MQYKINTAIKVNYLSVDKESGLTDLILTPTNPSDVDQSPIAFSEVGDGLYTASFTPDSIGIWTVRVTSVLSPENIYAQTYLVNSVDVAPYGIVVDFYPENTAEHELGEIHPLQIDPAGNLMTRSAVLTDEGSFYEPFSGSNLSDKWSEITEAGTNITIADSHCNLTLGTTALSQCAIYRTVDYPPLTVTFTLSVSQRIANQDIYFGYGNDVSDPVSDTMFARFHLTGTNNTIIRCETQASSDTNGNEGLSTDIVLPLGIVTSENIQYKIENDGQQIKFFVGRDLHNLQLVAIRSIQIPDPYTIMMQRIYAINGTTPASSTTIAVDMVSCHNYNLLDAKLAGGEVNSIKQEVSTSIVNSSISNLAASSSFTGVGESTLGIAGIQVNIKSSQPTTIQVQQSIDSTNWDIIDTWYVSADTGDGRTFQATASYFRVVATNTGAIDTTYFRLQTCLCPIVGCLPRTLSSTGDLKVDATNRSIAELDKFFYVNREHTCSTSNETDSILIKNPSTSNKKFYLKNILISGMGTVTVRTRVRFYKNATITSDGTPLTIENRNIGTSLLTSVGEAYYTPTISARGSQIFVYAVNECDTKSDDFNLGQILYPGHNILITIQNDSTNKVVAITFVWAELP